MSGGSQDFPTQSIHTAVPRDTQLSGAVFTRMETLPDLHASSYSLIYPGLVVCGPVITEIMWYMSVIATISRIPAPCHLYRNSQVEQDHNQKYLGSSRSICIVS